MSASPLGHPLPIAKLTLEIEIVHAQSLKDRRQVVRSLKDRLRRGFNLSIAELDEVLAWNRATLAIVCISRSRSYLVGQVAEIERAARGAAARFGAEILESYAEFLSEDRLEDLDTIESSSSEDRQTPEAAEEL